MLNRDLRLGLRDWQWVGDGELAPRPARLELTGWPPAVLSDIYVEPENDNLTLTGHAPVVGVSKFVAPGEDALTLTGQAPGVLVDEVVFPDADTLTLTGYAPTVTAGAGTNVEPGTDTLTITGQAPTPVVDQVPAPGTDTLVVTGYAPLAPASEVVTPGADTLSIMEHAPNVSIDTFVAPGPDSLEITEYAPTPLVDQVLAPGVDGLIITEYTPTVSTTGGTTTHSLIAYDHFMSYSGGTYTATVSTSSIQEGDLVLAVVFDRSGTSGAHATHSMSDDNSGTWTKIFGYDNALTNSTHRCAMSVYYHIGTATDEGDTVACTSESGDIYNGLALYIYRPDSGTYNYNPVGYAVDGTGTLLTDMTTPLSSGSTSSISGSNLLSIGIAAGREAGGSSFDAINDVGFTNHNEDYTVQSASIDHAGTWAIAHLSGQAGGTFEAEYDCNNSGIEGIVAVVVFEDGS